MTDRPAAAPGSRNGPIEEDSVIAYLRDHPDFLIRHPEMGAILAPPSRWPAGDSVVDLQHFMIESLKDELNHIEGCTEDLINTARSNHSVQGRTHEAALAVLAARGMDRLAHVVIEELPLLLDVDAIAIGFETGPQPIAELASGAILALPPGSADLLLGGVGHTVLLADRPPAEDAIFGAAASLVQSYALIRLTVPGLYCPGLLALGSREVQFFHPHQGTELLTFLTRILELAVARWVENSGF